MSCDCCCGCCCGGVAVVWPKGLEKLNALEVCCCCCCWGLNWGVEKREEVPKAEVEKEGVEGVPKAGVEEGVPKGLGVEEGVPKGFGVCDGVPKWDDN